MAKITGGTRLANELAVIAARLRNPGTLKVGFLAGATYPDGTPVALIAAIHNYGAPRAGIPRRPFFTDMVVEKSPEWGPAVARLLKQNHYNATVTLRLVGEGIKGQLQQAIRDFSDVPLKPATIRRKGHDKQLIDTGQMLRSADYVVE